MSMNFCHKHNVRHPYGQDCHVCINESLIKSNSKPQGKFQYYGELHQEILLEASLSMEGSEKIEMETKLIEVVATKKFGNYESRLIFEDAFRMGYLSTKVEKVK